MNRKNFVLPVVGLVILVVAGSFPGRAMSRETAAEPAGLGGTSWEGSETLAGYGDLAFDFHEDGTAIMFDADGKTCGTWCRNGARVTLSFYDGTVIYQGTISGDTIRGTARNARTCWCWCVQRD